MLFDTVLAFDHVKHRILIIANARVTADDNLEALYQFACAKIQFLERELERSLSEPEVGRPPGVEVRSNTTRETFEQGVRKAKDYIAGRRYLSGGGVATLRSHCDGRSVHGVPRAAACEPLALHVLHPHGDSVDRWIVAEMLVRVEGRRAETHPIAGTRPRGHTEEEDIRLAEELKGNEKERAEHVMLVDLGRNDLGRVCEYGSVRVPQFMGLERYSHVMHLVSRVEGTVGRRSGSPRRAGFLFPRRHSVGCSQDQGDGDHQRAGADEAGHLRRCNRLFGLRGQPGLLYHHPHHSDEGWTGVRASRGRDRSRLRPGGGVRGDPGQGVSAPAGARDGARGTVTLQLSAIRKRAYDVFADG